MSLIHNERWKLTANWLNALASGIIITGVVAPAIAVLFRLQTAVGISPVLLALSSIVWLLAGIALHLTARRILKRLLP
jgi:hypothetical protein